MVHLKSNTLAKMATRGVGPRFVRAGTKAVRYRVYDLDAWLEQNASRPTTADC